MKLMPLLLAGGALGGASWLGTDAVPPTPIRVPDARWELGRIHLRDGGGDQALVVEFSCVRGCALRVALEAAQPAR